MKKTFDSKSTRETMKIAKSFAKDLRVGDIVTFQGDLGSGKTTFIKGLAVGLGVKDEDEVKSPTYVIMHIYDGKMPIYHYDLYRLEGGDQLDILGFDEFVREKDTVVCIEWPERAGDFPMDVSHRVSIKSKGESSRKITLEYLNKSK